MMARWLCSTMKTYLAVILFSCVLVDGFVHSALPSLHRAPHLRGGGVEPIKCSKGFDLPTVKLNDGTPHPLLGFGTYKVGFIPASASSAAGGAEQAGGTEATARECVLAALQTGYRFLDCAQFYGNEAEVGLALEDSGIEREDLFLASKVWTDKIYEGEEAVRAQVEKTLKDLKTDYLDLYLVHWPVPGGKHVKAYKVLEEMHKEGKLKAIGMSNYAIEDYEELTKECTVQPAINQIEVNPFLYRKKTIDFFQQKGIQIQSYRALRDGKAFDHPLIASLATKYKRTPAQILGRWCVQKGVIYIPKSVKRERMFENACVFDFELAEDDMAELDALTTDENIQKFRELYEKCVIRDTPWADTDEGKKLVKVPVTYD